MNNFKTIEIVSDSTGKEETKAPKRSVGGKSKTLSDLDVKTVKIQKMVPDVAYPCTLGQTKTSTGTAADVSSKSERDRSRKSQHGARSISADPQLESVAADGLGAGGSKASKKQDKARAAIKSFVQSDEMQGLIKRIAIERIRCNFLLTAYQLPDMSFTLNTPMDTLRNRFEKCLQQRRDRGYANSTSSASSPASCSQKLPAKGVAKAKNP